MRHKGAEHIQTAVFDMSFYQYFLFVVLLFLFIIIFIRIWISYLIFKRISQVFINILRKALWKVYSKKLN